MILKVIVEFLGVLRRELGVDRVEVYLEGSNKYRLRDLLLYLLSIYPKMSSAVNNDGSLDTSYLVFVNEADFMVVGGYEYEVRDGDKITFIPISHGGSKAVGVEDVWRKLCEDLSKMELKVFEISSNDALTLIRDIDKVQVSGCITQVLPSTLVLSDKQLLLASLLTFKAFEEGRNVSRKPYIEFLLRLFSNRQISDIITILKNVSSGSYLLVRVCKGVEDLSKKPIIKGSEVSPSQLFQRFNTEYIGDLIKAYGLEGDVGLDISRIHSLILTKISLFQII